MKISSKSRYAISALIYMAEFTSQEQNITLSSISDKLEISKIYLEQIFSQLKKANIVSSEKGFQGGYKLIKPTSEVSVGDIMRIFELKLYEKPDTSITNHYKYIEKTMDSFIYKKLDSAIKDTLDHIYLSNLVKEADKLKYEDNLMYYI